VRHNLFPIDTPSGVKFVVLEPLDRLFQFQRAPHDFFKHCHDARFDHPWRIISQTCANCGITYAAHFDHPQRARRG
jgi:hypothetical protein